MGMFSKKNSNVNGTQAHDLDELMKAMDKVIAGVYTPADLEPFQNKAVGEKLNELIAAFKKSNNNFVMRLNEAMLEIGDNSCVKVMLDQVNSQTKSINDMEDSSGTLKGSIENISTAVAHIKENTHTVLGASKKSEENMTQSIKVVNESSEEIKNINEQVQSFHEKINKISEIIDMVKKIASQSNLLALNASIEAARAGEAGKGFAVVAEQVRQLSSNTSASAEDVVKYVSELQSSITELAASMDDTTQRLADGNDKVEQSVRDIRTMNEQMETIREEIDSIYLAVDTQSNILDNFGQSLESLSDSYKELARDCANTGSHMFQAGRNVDKSRSDMVRGFAEITKLDWVRIFEIDHFIFTWRQYNNLMEFEKLKLEQVNNDKGCKFGKWVASQTDDRITSSQAFKDCVKYHELLHKYATEAFYAKQEGNVDKGLEIFNDILASYEKFKASIARLKDVFRSIGEGEETQIIVYSK